MSFDLDIAGAIKSFRWNESEYEALIKGPVMQDLTKRAIRVESSMKQHASGRPGPKVRTGRLRGSITWRAGIDGNSPYVDIGSSVLYAPFVELGTGRAPAYPFMRPGLEAARTT